MCARGSQPAHWPTGPCTSPARPGGAGLAVGQHEAPSSASWLRFAGSAELVQRRRHERAMEGRKLHSVALLTAPETTMLRIAAALAICAALASSAGAAYCHGKVSRRSQAGARSQIELPARASPTDAPPAWPCCSERSAAQPQRPAQPVRHQRGRPRAGEWRRLPPPARLNQTMARSRHVSPAASLRCRCSARARRPRRQFDHQHGGSTRPGASAGRRASASAPRATCRVVARRSP